MKKSQAAKKAIIIGASTGIGAALACEMSRRGYELGLTARRTHLIEENLSPILQTPCHIAWMDVAEHQDSAEILMRLIDQMGGTDIIIINSAVSGRSDEPGWEPTGNLIRINVMGFARMVHESYRYFQKQGHGHIVGISSIASLIPHPNGSAYNASKAFVSNYLDSIRLRIRRRRENIIVTDVLPGFVDTPMTKENKRMFWVSSAEKVAIQIASDIEHKKPVSVVSRRWKLIAQLMKLLPENLLKRLL